jgi:effector-binding domain-containing protein
VIRIGDFSKLSQVPVKTLRYYDQVGLLEPAHVDASSGYRYYNYDQLARLNRILALKDLGFSLAEVSRLLEEGLSAEAIRGMLKLRQAEIRQQLQEETERYARVEARLEQIERENSMSQYDVVIKNIESLKVASVRGVVPTPPEQGRLWRQLEGYLSNQKIKPSGPCLSLYHDEEYKERDWDIEVCEPIEADVQQSEYIHVYELPGVKTMACVIHHGPLVTIGKAYDAIMRWIDENGYRVSGPAREVYLREADHGSQEDPETVTEVQFPVAKT